MLRTLTRLFVAVCAAGILSSTGASAQGKMEAEVVYLRDGGFFPNTLQRQPGRFLLIVKHRSSASEFALGISRADKTALVPAAKTLSSSRDFVLELGAGEYVVADSSHPAWTPLTITVKP